MHEIPDCRGNLLREGDPLDRNRSTADVTIDAFEICWETIVPLNMSSTVELEERERTHGSVRQQSTPERALEER